jgi:8-oxo-dGTP pyrophosphatase MutT (NUDIX family)
LILQEPYDLIEMYRNWVKRLMDELAKPLPGVDAQLRLSPPGRHHITPEKISKESAVLIVLYPDDGDICTIFIKRAEYNGAHSGQVGLPGGMYEMTDRNLRNTALRETCEETGICERKVQIIGSLTSLYIPVSGITVYPFVGYCCYKPDLKPDPTEVRYIIETTLSNLLDPGNQKHKSMIIGDSEIDIPYFDIDGDHIWGATAMIIAEFLEVLKRMNKSI